MADQMCEALFICTGNYYRSRFAEAYFERAAVQHQLPWRATSRGLDTDQPQNTGPMSAVAARVLSEMNVPFDFERGPKLLTSEDLMRADMIIAVDWEEHFPMVKAKFPEWTRRMTYWQIEDIDRAPPEDALPRLQREIDRFVAQLAAGHVSIDASVFVEEDFRESIA